ncbi:MAG: hypothetical protein M3R66_19275 [Actinomycetota bacterium]|nr:hypothetical protein [Actinomycetota bacterium]
MPRTAWLGGPGARSTRESMSSGSVAAPAGWSSRRWLAAALVATLAVVVALFVVRSVDASSGRYQGAAAPAGVPPDEGPGAEVYAVDCLAVGATVNSPVSDGRVTATLADFQHAAAELGPLTVRRSFDPTLPAQFATSSAGADPSAGLRSFVSWKPPGGDFRGAAAGRYDEAVRAWAMSVPRTGVYATAFHEPENDMTASEFVALQRHLYTTVKQANPTIQWGPVYMAYWWHPGQEAHYVGDPWAWWPGDEYADFSALDWYSLLPSPMTQSPSFLNWYSVMVTTGKPLLVTEYGQYVLRPGAKPDPALQTRRADAIRADAQWIADHEDIRMWLYWQAVGPQGNWRMEDQASLDAWREVAVSGCQRSPSGPAG